MFLIYETTAVITANKSYVSQSLLIITNKNDYYEQKTYMYKYYNIC